MLRNNNYFSLFSSYLSLLVFIIPNFCDFNKSSGAKSIVIGYKLLWLEDLFIFLHLLSGPQGSQQSCPDGIFLFVFCFNFYYFNLFQDIQGRCVSSSENIQWDNRKYGPVVKRFFFFSKRAVMDKVVRLPRLHTSCAHRKSGKPPSKFPSLLF